MWNLSEHLTHPVPFSHSFHFSNLCIFLPASNRSEIQNAVITQCLVGVSTQFLCNYSLSLILNSLHNFNWIHQPPTLRTLPVTGTRFAQPPWLWFNFRSSSHLHPDFRSSNVHMVASISSKRAPPCKSCLLAPDSRGTLGCCHIYNVTVDKSASVCVWKFHIVLSRDSLITRMHDISWSKFSQLYNCHTDKQYPEGWIALDDNPMGRNLEMRALVLRVQSWPLNSFALLPTLCDQNACVSTYHYVST